jgi:hypothetical protein
MIVRGPGDFLVIAMWPRCFETYSHLIPPSGGMCSVMNSPVNKQVLWVFMLPTKITFFTVLAILMCLEQKWLFTYFSHSS